MREGKREGRQKAKQGAKGQKGAGRQRNASIRGGWKGGEMQCD